MKQAWIAIGCVALLAGCHTFETKLTELQRTKSGQLDVVVLSLHDAIRHEQDSFVIEFRSADGKLVDVGDVKASATMPMAGTPMFGSLDVTKTPTPGRYAVDAKFDMAGTWRTIIERQAGPGGPASATLSATVQ